MDTDMERFLATLFAFGFTVWIFAAILRAFGFPWIFDIFAKPAGLAGKAVSSVPWLSVLFFPIKFLFGLSFGKGEGGDARFMNRFEKKRILSSRNRGFVMDGKGDERLSENDSFRNVAVVAVTGAGKTAGFIIPNVLSIDNGSMVIADPSGGIFAKTSADLAARGYSVRVINPADPNRSDFYNPLERAVTHTQMNEVAHILIRAGSGGSSGDRFWTDGAEDIVGILIRVLKRHPDDGFHNLANLYDLLISIGDGSGLDGFMEDYADDESFRRYKSFVSQSPNTMQGILSTAKTALRMLSDPDIAKVTSAQTFEFSELRERKTALFLIFPQNRVSYYAFMMNLLYTQLFHYCLDDAATGPSSLPIYFLLDEFGHATVPDFPAIVTTTRQRKIGIAIVLQSISQLEDRYGKSGAQTVLSGGVATRLFFSGMDIGTAEMLERTLGSKRHEVRDSEDRLYLRDDSLLAAAKLRTMDDDKVLFLFANKRPALLKLKHYYQQSGMKRRTSRDPLEIDFPRTGPVRYLRK